MVHAIAKDRNLLVVDIRLSQEDPTTINGFPDINNGRSDYLPPVRFPLKGIDHLPLLPEHKAKQADYTHLIEIKDQAKLQQFQKEYCYAGWLIFFNIGALV